MACHVQSDSMIQMNTMMGPSAKLLRSGIPYRSIHRSFSVSSFTYRPTNWASSQSHCISSPLAIDRGAMAAEQFHALSSSGSDYMSGLRRSCRFDNFSTNRRDVASSSSVSSGRGITSTIKRWKSYLQTKTQYPPCPLMSSPSPKSSNISRHEALATSVSSRRRNGIPSRSPWLSDRVESLLVKEMNASDSSGTAIIFRREDEEEEEEEEEEEHEFQAAEQACAAMGHSSAAGDPMAFAYGLRWQDRRVKVHPMAVVHSDAILEEGVEVGPFCTVSSGARLGRNCKMFPGSHVSGNTQLGEGCVLMHGAVVGEDIPGETVLGNYNRIGHHAVVGVKCQDMKYKEGDECFLFIGDRNDIREYANIHRSARSDSRTEIGHMNLIMGSTHVGHDCQIGNNNIFANGTLLAGHVVIGDFVHSGGAAAVHQFCHLGSYSFLAGGSFVDRDVPAYVMVAGNRAVLRGLNVVGLQRGGFSEDDIRSIRRVYMNLFFIKSESKACPLEERLLLLENDEEMRNIKPAMVLLKSVRSSFDTGRRGICKFNTHHA